MRIVASHKTTVADPFTEAEELAIPPMTMVVDLKVTVTDAGLLEGPRAVEATLPTLTIRTEIAEGDKNPEGGDLLQALTIPTETVPLEGVPLPRQKDGRSIIRFPLAHFRSGTGTAGLSSTT